MKDPKAEQLVSRIKSDLSLSMKQRDQIKIATLKSLLGSFANAEAVEGTFKTPDGKNVIAGATAGFGSTEVPRKELSAEDLNNIIRTEINELTSSLAKVQDLNDYRTELEQKKSILESYQLSS